MDILFYFFKEERFIPIKPDLLIIHNLLRTSDKELSARHKCLVELDINFIFCLLGKIDDHISANDEMTPRWVGILQQVVHLKLHPLLDLIRNLIGISDLRKILFLQIIRHPGDALLIVQTHARGIEHLLIDIRCNNLDIGGWQMP